MRRRDLLLGGGALGAAAMLPSRARAGAWGTSPTAAATATLSQLPPATKVLEVFLYGGLGPFESFWVVEDHGRPDDPAYPDQQWHLWRDMHERIFGERCGLDASNWLEDFSVDAGGRQVRFGPATAPLRARRDLMERTRVVAMRHDLEPHEAAIPLALSGMRLGNPRMCGLGAHVQRYRNELQGWRSVPHAYVFQPINIVGTDNTRAAEAVGQHPGSARPLSFRVGADDGVRAMLGREIYGDRKSAVDAYLAHRAAKQRERYSLAGTPLRARPLDDHRFATQTLANASDLQAILNDDFLQTIQGSSCGADNISATATGLEAAVALLTNPTAPASYACVVDTGLTEASGGGGYDTHDDHLPTQARNTLHLLEALTARINEPGENDPTKLDLDDTMIILTTEFGRTPVRQTNRGTNHFPYGYAQVMMGGPIGPDQAGVLGSIGADGIAEDYVTPSEFRAACLAAMGMYPFAHESFAVGDIRNVISEQEGLEWLVEHVLGRTA